MQLLRFEFQVPKGVNLPRSEIADVERVMPELFGMLVEHRALRGKQQRAELVKLLMRDVPMKPIEMKLVKLQARALERIYCGTPWLTADEIGTLGKHGTANPAAAAHRWKSSGQLFAIRRDGRDMYPRYALGDDFTPLAAIKKVLKLLVGFDPLRVAGWFESTSSFLGGRRPRELIASQPERVVLAAQDAAMQLEAA